MIQTHLGPVPLRRPRDPEKIALHLQKEKGAVRTIGKSWLQAKKGKEDDHAQLYRSALMQSMMIAATQMDLQDLNGRVAVNPDTGMRWTPQEATAREDMLKAKKQQMRMGTAPVPMRRLSTQQGIAKQSIILQKHICMKRRSRTGTIKLEYFVIDTGKLKIFHSPTDFAKVKTVYDLADVECRYENVAMPGIGEPFYSEYKDRVKVQLRERPHGPLYLYADDGPTARRWERAIKMSKYLVSASDKEALAFVVGRLAGSVMNKGWQALFTYSKEMIDTKHTVKNLAMRLLRVDISRGWTKARLVYVQQIESEKKRKEQQEYAAKFLKEKMERIGSQAARNPKLVRQNMVHQIQTKFRQYRQEKIFDRNYPLGSSVATRVQQAQAGTTMGSAFGSVTRDDALHLVLNDDSRLLLKTRPEIFCSKKSTYSEVNVPVCHLGVNVSESFSMLSFTELDEDPELTHLAKEGWAHFVNLDQISSVILHSERKSNSKGSRSELSPSMTKGVWFTINGPRVCWCRKLRTYVDSKTREVRKDLVGATNPLIVGNCLAQGQRLRWFKVVVQVRSSSIPVVKLVRDEEEDLFEDVHLDRPGRRDNRSGGERHTQMVLYLLGRKFTSDFVLGDNPVYPGRFEAEVPISYDEKALAALDECSVGVDIVERTEGSDSGSVIYAGKIPLWKVYVTEPGIAERLHNVVHEGLGEDVTEEVVSLAETLNSSPGRVSKTIALSPPSTGLDIIAPARIELEVNARVQESMESTRCISPELQGRGPVTSLFTSHRGAWFDPKLGEAKFFASRVANFIELAVGELHFPDADKVDQSKLFRYHIVAKCNGVTASTVALHRPKEIWAQVIPVDPNCIDFQGTKLFLPLPPGAWCADDVRPEIEIFIMRCPQNEEMTRTFAELKSHDGKSGPASAALERVYHATVLLDGMLVDEVRTGTRILLSRSTAPANIINMRREGESNQPDNPAILKLDAALRDRDYVRLNSADRGAANDLGQGFVLCVGDKAMLRVEEPLTYPRTELEFRRRFLPGTYDADHARRGNASSQSSWTAPLREPSMSHEYAHARFDKLPQQPSFKQRFMPTNCDDVIPHKFVLPRSELDFLREARPGVYWRIVDHMVAEHVREKRGEPTEQHKPVVVQELSHLVRHLPCTVLAVYADDTCDVELAPTFIREWEKHQERHYTIPGAVVIKRHKDISAAGVRAAPVGTGDVSERLRLRVVLKGVPISMMVSVQPAGFNVYDARWSSVDEAIKVPPQNLGNDFDPRGNTNFEDTGRRGGYALRPGPVPADAGPACLYEWSLHLHANSEDDMYHFVTALRQSVRIDVFQQLLKLQEWKRRSAVSSHTLPYTMGVSHTSSSGHLEVVLMEAKHLKPPTLNTAADMYTAVKQVVLRPLSTFASFEVRKNGTAMVYRGSKTQYAPVVGLDNNPCWADVEELKTSKGWVFKTPTLDPEKDDGDLTFEIEILDARARTSIGAVRINPQRFRSDMRNMQGLSGDWQEEGDDRHCINLFDPEFPFNDLWLPLFKKDGENSFTLDESCTAKVHVMTLWVPKHETARRKLLPKKPHEWRTFELQHRLHSNMVRDHIDDHVEIHGNRRGYNPNAWGTQWPLSYSAACAQHIEAIHYSIPYLKCCEVYDRLSWDSFQEKLVTTPAGRPSLAKSKEEWSRSSGEEASRNANALENLIRRGIEPAMRRHHWLDLTHAEKAIEEYEAGALLPMGQGAAQSSVQGLQNFRRKYRDLVRAGRSYRSSAMLQLSEDMVGASSWEVIQMAGIMDQHLDRISRAQDICIALITFSMDNNKEANLLNYASVQATAGAGERSCGVAYSESLLVLAFHLLLAISANDPDDHKAHAGGAAAAGPTGAGAQSAQEFQQEQMVDQNRQAQLLQAKRDEEEASVFWLLYSLIGYRENQALRDYFGAYSVNHSFVEHRGAMDDCNRLNCVIARHEYDLWVKLGALGFHLSMVFYGAFMRLYATYLPPQSCFRLWDLFFSDTPKRTDRPEKPKARSCLLDVAFAVLRKCKTKLMDCQSASEAKSVLLDCMERLYDTTELIEMTYQAHFAARESMAVHVSESVGIGSHAADYARSAALWEQFLPQFRMQNAALYELTKNLKLESTIFGKMLKGIRALFASENCERATFVGMHRVVPARIRRIGPEVDQSVVGKMTSWFSRVSETVYIENLSLPVALSLPKPADINAVTCGEPTQMDSNDFERQFGRVVGADWSPFMHKIFQAFASPSERRMSTNEVFISILCCAKGTLGEKAMELFKLFAVAQPKHSMHHIHPVSHTAATVVDKVDWNNKKAEGQVTKCPAPTEYKKHALHFKVYTHSTGNQEILMGEVFIPTLRPYLWSGMDREMVTEHKMWGMEARLPPGINMTTGNAAALVRDMGVRPEIGTMAMAIKWMPSSDHKQEEGQLGIHLKHIAFSNKYVEAHRLKNPRVEVITYDEDGHEQKIKRWDPRNILRKGTSAITDGVAYGGAFGDHISFEETETRMPNGSLRKKVGTGGNHGYFETVEGKKQEKVGKWCWNKRYGDQYSPEGTRMKREFVTSSASRPNTISLNACRLITRTLLWRSLNCVTNRAAMQIADETFSRAGCVPGILDALLMRSDAVPQDIHSTAQLKASLQTSRASFVDVTHQVMLCYEDTMDRAAGSTALFPPIHGVSNYSLSALEISDPCPGQLKVLWVRYVRAGDGQRRNARIQVERDGTFAPQNLAIDMDEESQVSKIQMSVTKEEFVGCILSSPLLSESLRQFSAADNDMTNVKSDTTGINLDVIIADPMAEAEDEDFLDALNVRQRIFFEVWDKDYTSRDDFLGECFLPPLNLLSEDPKMFVLPLTDCPHTDDRTMTRPYERKLAPKPGSAVGNLFVEASWKFPFQALEEIGEQDDIQTRVKKEEALHTGQLTLKIVKASGLRSADVRRQAGSDPYVMVYCRNETLPDKDEPNVPGIGDGGWRTDPKTGFHKCLMRTGVKHGTVNPEWGESQALMLQTGAFERRTNRSEWRSVIGSFDITGRSKKFQNDDHALDVLHGRQEGSGMGRGNQRDVRIYFGGADLKSGDKNIVLGQTDGYRHDVKVYMTDSIFQFKKKIMKACELEVKYMDDNRKKVAPDVKKRASYVQLSRTINYRHAVMVFVPSQKLREFAQQQRENAREYRRLYRLEEQDPNSWQPLDQIRDFDSYKAQFGFGMDVPQRLRVTEGTEEYKTKNARYKQFAEEQSAWRKRVHSLNNEEECFGYAKYKHPYDGNSTEWRQAIIDRPDAPPGEVRKVFKTWFIHSPAHTMPGQAIAPGQALKEELEETEVLLAPANPRLYTTRHLEHFEFLAQAYNLREKEHLTDQAIAARFNKEMKEKYAKERQYGETAAPAEITVRDVQHALRSGGGMRKNDSSSSIGIEDVSAAARPRRVSVTHH